MPLYEYECTGCSERVEILTRTYDAPQDPVCKRCGSTSLRRLMSRVPYNRLSSQPTPDLATIDRDVKRRFEKKVRSDSLLG